MSEIRLGKVTGQEVSTARNGAAQVRKLQVTMGDGSPRLIQYMPQSGEDTCPSVGDRVFFVESGESFFIAVATSDKITPTVAAGEKEFYSSDGSTKKARHKLKASGKQYLGNSGGDLRTALDSLHDALSTFAGSASQSAVSTGGSSSVALAAALVALMIPLAASVASAKTALDAVLDNTP
jgi:hypothetical protein